MVVPLKDLESSCLPCGSPPNRMAWMFCGSDGGECEHLNQSDQFHRSWTNIIEYYDYVGITEDLKKSIEILENMFPSFFTGMGQLFSSTKPERVTARKTEYVIPSKDTRNKLEKYLSIDLELYKRVKKRHYQQSEICRMKNQDSNNSNSNNNDKNKP